MTLPKSFDGLFAELSAKVARHDPESSTVARVDAGVHEVGKKIVEEAAELRRVSAAIMLEARRIGP